MFVRAKKFMSPANKYRIQDMIVGAVKIGQGRMNIGAVMHKGHGFIVSNTYIMGFIYLLHFPRKIRVGLCGLNFLEDKIL